MTDRKDNLFMGIGIVIACIIAIICMLCSSCANTKKTTKTQLVKSDSTVTTVSTSRIDTSRAFRDITAQDISFDVYYAPPDPKDTATTRQWLNAAHKQAHDGIPAIDWLPDHSRIIRIMGHIGAMSDSSVIQLRTVDSVAKKKATGSTVVEKVQVVESSWHWPLWLTIACIAAGLIVLLMIVKKITSWI